MNKIALRRGLPLFACFLGLFILMKLIGQVQNFNFRVLNGLFHIVFVYLAIRDYKKSFAYEFNYLSGTAMGMLTSLCAVIPFAIFMVAYLNIDSSLMEYLKLNVQGIGDYLNPVGAGIIILMEGLAISIILSYVITRLFAR